uniref:Retrovirus-related Pol polyprotein from transposon TNT 1-94 n=1 Tax=Tanacetum cinerariifolium TaxID=118510 RepID=A0A6L2JJZ6_TANCI|nr:retrovirus-related Pol polyprotein from transposon TNT 1-94 [Tanacetum cinerariifolium]
MIKMITKGKLDKNLYMVVFISAAFYRRIKTLQWLKDLWKACDVAGSFGRKWVLAATVLLKSRKEVTDYGFHFDKIPIYCDSKSDIAISCNPVQHSRTKHIAFRFHFIKEHVEKGMIELYFVKTDYQLADIFTKALPTDRFNYLVRRLGSDDGVTTSFQLSRNSRPSMLDHQDKYIMKAQIHVSKSSAISDVQSLPRRKHYCQIYQIVKHMLRRRLLASFQDLKHEGGDTRSQGGIKNNDSKIKIQDHWHANDHSNEFPRTTLQVSRKVHLNDHPLGGDC